MGAVAIGIFLFNVPKIVLVYGSKMRNSQIQIIIVISSLDYSDLTIQC